ncbi:7283_t:CDS:2 [Gigaspora margarita]|uniref:7283_t:CDS:1 n=1 Tax=Gigaspora margarita TaxID=4874 RepID=A0ABN7UM58_GIGMA|nr:7283_t:CDS:2 [Gigaspora margarita]
MIQIMKEGIDAYRFDQEGNFHPLDIKDGDRVVGLDPGRNDLFITVTEEKYKIKCSTKEWHSLTDHTHAWKKTEV